MTRFFPLLLLAAASLGACPARAQEHPPAIPQKDALIGYHLVPAQGEAIDVRVALRSGQNGLRMDLPDQTFVLVDRGAQSVTMVVPLERAYMDLPWAAGPQDLFMVNDRTKVARKGDATIAGQRCTNWESTDKAHPGTQCVTADGLVMRSVRPDDKGRPSVAEAFVVRFAASPDGEFHVPPGLERMAPGGAP